MDGTGVASLADGAPAPAPSAPQPAAPAQDPLLRKLVWVTLFRLILVTVLLGGTAMWEWRVQGESREVPPLYAMVLATYVLSLGFAVVLRAARWLRPLAYAQIALDVAVAAAVVALTGWADSVFVFMFSLAVVEGGILLFRRGAWWGSGLALATYLPLAVLAAPRAPPVLTLFAHGGAFVATAALASYLADQLRRTGERLAEREVDLATITALHEAIVQSVSSGLLTVDDRGRITFLNRAGEQITGLRLEEVRGEPAARWFAALEPGAGRDEREFVNARGERVRLGYGVFPLRGRSGGPIGEAMIFQDLTGLRAMEERVARSERLAALGQVAAGLAHELRNPLASMTGSIELLRMSASLGGDDARLMDIVLREAERLNGLVAGFLDYSRPAEPRREEADLSRLVAETLDVFTHDPAAARVRVDRVLSPARAWCDAAQVRQVLWNLLGNAAQAARRSAEAPGRISVRCAPDREGGARLVVEDDGPGIAPQDLPQIFTPFYTTKERGTGLGLAIVQRIVDAHQGTVWAESEPGRGARFTVRLPGPPAAPRAR